MEAQGGQLGSATPEAAGREAAPARTVGAAVDVGSISVHLLVAAVDGHDLQAVADESVFLRLGARVDAAGYLGREARASVVETLAGYVGIARTLGATALTLLGAEPMRRAADAARVVAAMEDHRVALHVLTSREEACLTLLGVTAGRRPGRETIVVDIGGGSTEVVTLTGAGEVSVDGLATGSGRLTAGVRHDPPSPEDVGILRLEARALTATLPRRARPGPDRAADEPGGGRPERVRELVAVGGTASNLAKVLGAAPEGRVLGRPQLEEALAILLSEPSAAAAERHALNPVRARTLPAGAVILEAILDRFGAPGVRISEAGMREGAVLAAARAPFSWRDRLPGLVVGWD